MKKIIILALMVQRTGNAQESGGGNTAQGQDQASHGKSDAAPGGKKAGIAHAKNLNKQGEKAISDLAPYANAEQTGRASKALAELNAVLAEVEANPLPEGLTS